MREINRVGIISKPNIARAADIVCTLIEWLEARGVSYRCDEQTAQYAPYQLCAARNAAGRDGHDRSFSAAMELCCPQPGSWMAATYLYLR